MAKKGNWNRSGQRSGRGGSNRGRGDDRRSPERLVAQKCKAPYHFVPVEPDASVLDSPVFHDVQQTTEQHWSGELHCTLTALTPLLAGNYQIDYQYLSAEVQAAFQKLLHARDAIGSIENDKHVIEPLRVGETSDKLPQCILIAGQSIKGAVRQSLQALLSAPMERVQERTFSFRPNLMDSKCIRPAIVHSRNGDAGLEEIAVEFAEDSEGNQCTCDDVVYIFSEAIPALQKWIAANYDAAAKGGLGKLPTKAPRADINDFVPGVGITGPVYAKKLRRGDGQDLSDYVLVSYTQGLDGTSTFKQAFNGRRGYEWALVKVNHNIDPAKVKPVNIPSAVVRRYAATLDHIGNSKTGHLLQHPSKDKLGSVPDNIKNFVDNQWPQPGDLLYVEFDREPKNKSARIVAIGHQFRYRCLYRDSVHLTGDFSQPAAQRLRTVLCPAEIKRSNESDPSQRLSAARLLFGYVAPDKPSYDAAKPNEPLTFGLGGKNEDFRQLAGRISANFAVEVPRHDGKDRFLNQQHGCLVPLRPLAEPKASAVEMYLTQDRLGKRQDQGTLCTYGDTLDDDSAGELRGRKFYLHQPLARTECNCYELTSRNDQDWELGGSDNKKLAILSQHSALARFVSTPDTRFRCTVRFRDLRAWELGALLFTTTADKQLLEALLGELGLIGDQCPAGLSEWLNHVPGWHPSDNQPLLAVKLGHGRPLGLGSVQVAVDTVRRLRFDEHAYPTTEDHAGKDAVRAVRELVVRAFAKHLVDSLGAAKVRTWAERVLLPWLQVHRYAGRKRFDYPRGKTGQSGLIYDFHTEQRRQHAKGRKLPKANPNDVPPAGGLVSLDELDDGK